MPATLRAIVAYDANCGPCTSFRRAIELIDAGHRFAFVSIAEAEQTGMLDSLPESARWSSFHLLTEQGVQSGGRALPEVARFLPLGSVLSSLIRLGPGGQRVTLWLYSTLSRLHNNCSRQLNGGSTGVGPVSRSPARSTVYS